MSYASRSGRARTSATNPQAFGVCDRCGIWTNRVKLRNQMEWRGATILPLYIYVCNDCYDIPQEQLRSIVIPADPVPIIQPRVEAFDADETTYMGLAGSTTDPTTGIPIPNTTAMSTVNGVIMTPEPIGRPASLAQGAVMPNGITAGAPANYDVAIPVLSVIANGTAKVAVTCSSPHGLVTDQQFSVEGLENPLANGLYSAIVTSATAFSYIAYADIAAGSLLGSATRMVTAQVGLPLSYSSLPQVGP